MTPLVTQVSFPYVPYDALAVHHTFPLSKTASVPSTRQTMVMCFVLDTMNDEML